MEAVWRPSKRFKARAKLLLGMPHYCQQLRLIKSAAPKVLLIGTPLHDNLGDHLLALAALDVLKRAFSPKRYIVEVPTELYMLERESIVNSLHSSDIVAVAAGGWMGNLWPDDDAILRDVVCSAQTHCRAIVLPQTVYYDNNKINYTSELEKARRVWKSSSAILCVREHSSFNTATEVIGLSKTRVRLLPDLGLVYPCDQPHNTRAGVVSCLRSDREQVGNWYAMASEYAAMIGEGLRVTSTLTNKLVPTASRHKRVELKINEFASAKLAVTDRLHGLIFALLAGTPCVYFDNATGKVSGVANAWLKGFPGILDGSKDDAGMLVKQVLTGASQEGWWLSFAERQELYRNQIVNSLKELVAHE